MGFREWLNESNQEVDIIGKIFNATNSAKNGAWYKGSLFLEFKKTKTALNLQKKMENALFSLDDIESTEVYEIKDHHKMTKAILNNKNAVAVFEIQLGSKPKDAMRVYKIKELSDSEVKANGKAMGF